MAFLCAKLRLYVRVSLVHTNGFANVCNGFVYVCVDSAAKARITVLNVFFSRYRVSGE